MNSLFPISTNKIIIIISFVLHLLIIIVPMTKSQATPSTSTTNRPQNQNQQQQQHSKPKKHSQQQQKQQRQQQNKEQNPDFVKNIISNLSTSSAASHTWIDDEEATILDVFGQVAKDILTNRLIPCTDAICDWKWNHMRCEPFCLCSYQPQWGDYHLGRSCRKREVDLISDLDLDDTFIGSGSDKDKDINHKYHHECQLPPDTKITKFFNKSLDSIRHMKEEMDYKLYQLESVKKGMCTSLKTSSMLNENNFKYEDEEDENEMDGSRWMEKPVRVLRRALKCGEVDDDYLSYNLNYMSSSNSKKFKNPIHITLDNDYLESQGGRMGEYVNNDNGRGRDNNNNGNENDDNSEVKASRTVYAKEEVEVEREVPKVNTRKVDYDIVDGTKTAAANEAYNSLNRSTQSNFSTSTGDNTPINRLHRKEEENNSGIKEAIDNESEIKEASLRHNNYDAIYRVEHKVETMNDSDSIDDADILRHDKRYTGK